MKSNLFFGFVACVFGVISKKPLPYPGSWGFTVVFSSKSFIVLALTYVSFIYFELFLYTVWSQDQTSFFCMCCPVVPAPSLEVTNFWIFLHILNSLFSSESLSVDSCFLCCQQPSALLWSGFSVNLNLTTLFFKRYLCNFYLMLLYNKIYKFKFKYKFKR